MTEVPKLPPRGREDHKGDYGRVLVVGGSIGMPGAVALAANAALRGGAGLVTFAAPRVVQPVIAALSPCATSVPLACDEDGQLAPEALRQMRSAADKADVLAVGPGLAVGTRQQELVREAMEIGLPVVLDADGLNNLARMNDWPQLRRGPLVLTPHPGEFSRLTGSTIEDIRSARETAAHAAVSEWTAALEGGPPLVCVLKGADTVVANGRRLYVNATGNPGMATGGSGDVLTGLTAALLAGGLELFDAACLAVWAHGRAGDLAAKQLGQVSLIASDLLDFLPAAMRELAP